MIRNETMACRSSGGAIAPEIRVAITLCILSRSSFHDLMMLLKVASSTVYAVFKDTVYAVCRDISLPGPSVSDTAELERLADDFSLSRRGGSPLYGCVDDLDGICVRVKRPLDKFKSRGYFCRKGFYYSVPLQAIDDSSYRFLYMSARCVGSSRSEPRHGS